MITISSHSQLQSNFNHMSQKTGHPTLAHNFAKIMFTGSIFVHCMTRSEVGLNCDEIITKDSTTRHLKLVATLSTS